METTIILQNISKHVSLNQEEEAFFLSLLKEQSLSRKELVLSEGQACRTLYFVNSGTLRAFYMDKSARESTILFATPGWWITDMYCFVNEKPAMLYMEALGESSVLLLQKKI